MCFKLALSLVTYIVALAGFTLGAPQLAGQGSGRTIPIAKRANWLNADNSVNFDALGSHVASVEAKIRLGLENYERNTGSSHPSAMKEEGTTKRGSSNPLTNYYEIYWYGNFSIGTPPEVFTAEFDTGSGDLFLPRNDCGSCPGHYGWIPSSSSTSHDLGKTFTFKYEDGSTCSGEQYTDTVAVAGVTATTQTLGAATSYSDHLQKSIFPSDGLMGLGFLPIAVLHAPSFFDTVVREGQVADPAFSVKLADQGSELYLGGSNAALYTGSFTYVPLNHIGWWQVIMDSIAGHSQIFSNVDCIIDTGTTGIIASPDPVAQLYAALGGKAVQNGFYSFPCNAFPTISLTFGGTTFPISPSTLNFGPVSAGSADCISGIFASTSPFVRFWIIGDVFLRNVYTRFDFGNTSVGFAHLA